MPVNGDSHIFTIDNPFSASSPLHAVHAATAVAENVTRVVEKLNNVLYSGRPAFSAGSGAASLFKVMEGGKAATRVPVVLGRSSVNVIEIVRGLEIGDKIIVSDMSQYANVARVRIK